MDWIGPRAAPPGRARGGRERGLVRPCRASARLHAVGDQPADRRPSSASSASACRASRRPAADDSITEAGALLLTHADGITARLQAAQADLEALGAGDAGPLRIGTYQ